MTKNYKKIYQRLLKEIKKMKRREIESKPFEDGKIGELCHEIESSYAVSTLNCVLEMANELEGKKFHNAIMNREEFESNKRG